MQPLWIDNDSIPEIPKGKLKIYIENRLAKVNRDLKSSKSNQTAYLKKVKQGLMRYRWSTMITFVKNVFKMPLNVSFQLVKEFINRRIGK